MARPWGEWDSRWVRYFLSARDSDRRAHRGGLFDFDGSCSTLKNFPRAYSLHSSGVNQFIGLSTFIPIQKPPSRIIRRGVTGEMLLKVSQAGGLMWNYLYYI